MSTTPPIILAVDTSDIELAKKWLAATQGFISAVKLGLEFFTAHGSQGMREIQESTSLDIFLDLKLHDIPNTVGAAAQEVARLNPRFLTVHASGGAKMIEAAVAGAPKVEITAVTILTSLSQTDVADIGFRNGPLESAVALAVLAHGAGARAIVCSPLETEAIRRALGANATIITPGVRAAEAVSHDQTRTMSARDAIAAGANYVVIGRPITSTWSEGPTAMRAAAAKIAAEIS